MLKEDATDDMEGEYDFGCGDEDDDAASVVSSCMGDRSFDRTGTDTDNEGPAGNDDVDDEQRNEIEKNETCSRVVEEARKCQKKRNEQIHLEGFVGVRRRDRRERSQVETSERIEARTNAGESSVSRGEILQDEDGSTSHFVEEEHQRLKRKHLSPAKIFVH